MRSDHVHSGRRAGVDGEPMGITPHNGPARVHSDAGFLCRGDGAAPADTAGTGDVSVGFVTPKSQSFNPPGDRGVHYRSMDIFA